MTRPLFLLALLFTAVAGFPFLGAEPAVDSGSPMPDPSGGEIGVETIRRGMHGYGLTVFEGTEIERFDVEVVDVLTNFLPKQDVILIRCGKIESDGSDRFDTIGIVAGMSGSPIYLMEDGEAKLAGALAYGWSYQREPIAGVTPIAAMRADIERPVERTEWSALPPGEDLPDGLRRIATPLMVSGVSDRRMARLRERFEPFGMIPIRSGSGSAAADDEALQAVELEPGAAIGVQLMRGDMDYTAVGTVTWRDGDRVLAFGHPMFQAGEVLFPVTTAYVHTIIARDNSSFKLASAIEPVGVLFNDRQASIAATLEHQPTWIPASIRIRNRATEAEESFEVEVIRHDMLTPYLLDLFATWDALAAAEPNTWDPMTVDYRLELQFEGRAPLVVENSYVREGSAYSWTMLDPLWTLAENPYESLRLERVRLDVGLVRERGALVLLDAEPDRAEVRPGGTVRLRCRMRGYREEETVREIEVTVPEETPAGPWTVSVIGGGEYVRRLPRPETVDHLFERIREIHRTPARSLILSTVRPGSETVLLPGRRIPNVPPSVADRLARSDPAADRVPTEATRTIRMERILYGSAQAVVNVVR